MLNEEQLQEEVTITGGTALILLQVVARVVSLQNGLKDVELKPVGDARESVVAALEAATGVNFDRARAQQQAELQQRMAAARAAQARQEDGDEETDPAAAAEEAGDEETVTVK